MLLQKRWGPRLVTAAGVAWVMAACGGDNTAPKAMNIEVSPTAVNVQAGQTTTATVTVSRLNGFAGPVAVTASGMPAGVTIADLAIGSNSTSGTLQIVAGADAAASTGAVTLTATGSGVATKTATLNLTVQAAPSMSLAAPGTVNVQAGQTGTATLTLTRQNGFTGDVTVAASGMPTGVSIAAITIPAGSTSGTLSIVTGVDATVGNATVTLTATGTGVATKTATFTLAVAAAPSFTMTLPATATLQAGGSAATAAITLTRAGGFAGPVALTVTGMPTGLTAAIDSAAIGGNSATLTLTAAVSLAAGTYNLTLHGNATGLAERTAPIAVTVTAAGSYALALNPTTLTLQAGSNGAAVVKLNRNAFTLPVGLAVTGAPAGMTATLDSATLHTDSTFLRVTTTSALAAGTYTLTVTSSVSGLADQTATLTVQVTPAGSFTLALNPSSISVQAGASGTSTVTATRLNDFALPVALTVTGAPGGMTVTLDSATIGGASTVLHVTTTSALAVGSYELTVHGNATGMTEQTAKLTVQVTAAGGFTLSMNPASVSLQVGGSATSTVNVNRTGGFASAVALTVTGAPTGMTVTLDSASVGGTSTVLHITTASSLAAGAYTLTIHGNVAGLAEQTATLAVTATAAGTDVAYTFCDDLPVWVAVQDGSGAWTRITSSSNTYTFPLASGKGGLAVVTGDATSGYTLAVTYAATAEFQANGASAGNCSTTATGKTVHGSVLGLTATNMVTISLGGASAGVYGLVGDTFTVKNVPDRLVDLGAAKYDISSGFTLLKLYLQRGLNPADGSTLAPIDFAGPYAYDPVSATVNVANIGSDRGSVLAMLRTANGSILNFSFGDTVAGGSATFKALPSSALVAGDVHEVMVAASGADTTLFRNAGAFFTDPANQTVTLGPAITGVSASAVGGRPQIVWTVQTGYDKFFGASFQQSGTPSRQASVYMSSAYAGGSNVTLLLPDLSGVAGWNAAYGLGAGATTWNLVGMGWSGTGDFLGLPWTPGVTFTQGGKTGSLIL